MTETTEETHWIQDSTTRKRFWAYVKGDLALTEDEVHEALLCEHVAEFDGDKAAAMARLEQFSKAKIDVQASTPSVALDGIKTISVTYERKFNLGNYESLHIGMTAWADVHDETTYEEVQAEMWAWVKEAVKKQAIPVIREVKPASPTQTTVTPAPQPTSPTAPAPSGPPPPPTGNAPQASDMLQTEFVKVTAPKGKPVVEFWRPNRRYAEIRWQLGGEALMKIAPTLTEAGWLAEHFEAIGEEYQLPLNVHWVPSKPDGKYKDITLVELR